MRQDAGPAAVNHRPAGRRLACSRHGAGRLLGALALAVTLHGDLAAQSPPRLYQVEIVIFAQPQGQSLELPPLAPDPGPGPLDGRAGDAIEHGRAGAGDAAAAADPPGKDTEAWLPAGVSAALAARRLGPVAQRLGTGEYRLLWHQAWVQPAAAAGNLPLPVLAGLGGGPAVPGLSGTIGLAAGRFLHLDVDIELRSPEGLEARLRERRRVRINEQHYLDNPGIGVIALVTAISPD